MLKMCSLSARGPGECEAARLGTSLGTVTGVTGPNEMRPRIAASGACCVATTMACVEAGCPNAVGALPWRRTAHTIGSLPWRRTVGGDGVRGGNGVLGVLHGDPDANDAGRLMASSRVIARQPSIEVKLLFAMGNGRPK